MNPQLRKEVRLLLPAWCAALLLVALPWHWFLRDRRWLDVVSTGIEIADFGMAAKIACFILGLLLLAVSLFGREFSQRTFQLFLSQPIRRDRAWRQKVAVLGTATVSVWLIFWMTHSAVSGLSLRVGAGSLTVALAIGTTGLWTTLLFRQIMPAFSFSLLLPALLVPVLWPMAGPTFPLWIFAVTLLLLALYAVAAFYLARALFRRSEDLEPWLANLSLFFGRTRGPSDPFEPTRRPSRRSPIWVLAVKEMHLQQVNVICGSVLFLLLGLMAVVLAGRENQAVVEGIHIGFIVAWLFMPALAGSVAIAEERKIGALGIQQCLPVSRAWQFLVKLGATCGAVFLLGLVLPLILFWALAAVLGVSLGLGELRMLLVYTVVAGTVAFYSSSLSRSTLGALVMTVVILGGVFLAGLALAAFWTGFRLFVLLALPLGLIVLLRLSFLNFRQHLIDRRLRWLNINAVGATAAVAVLFTALIHYRTWEFVLPEAPFGPPEPALAEGAEIYSVGQWSEHWLVHLPDGRLWVSEKPGSEAFRFPANGTFVSGSGWLKVAASDSEVAGIRTDGSLWRSFGTEGEDGIQFEPLMEGAQWKDLAASEQHFLAIQSDSSLWGWGNNHSGAILGRKSKRQIVAPVRIGSGSPTGHPFRAADWDRVLTARHMSIGIKEDGSVWRWGGFSDRLDRWKVFAGGNLTFIDGERWFYVVILSDGSLWAEGALGGGYRPPGELKRLSERSDWQSAAVRGGGGNAALAALTDSGTLWGANVSLHPERDSRPVHPTERLSSHSGWVALTEENWNFYALAPDGTWWVWEAPGGRSESDRPLLVPSRRPRRLGE